MIWEEPIYKERSLEEWIEEVTLPVGIEKHAAKAKLPKEVNLLAGALVIADEKRSEEVVGGVLRILKNHADEVACSTVSQVLRGLARFPRWNRPDITTVLEAPDLLIVYGTRSIAGDEERLVDRALMARGFRPPRVTVLIGKTGTFPHLRDAYGESRTHEFRSKASKKGS